jgi:hypothetical protein
MGRNEGYGKKRGERRQDHEDGAPTTRRSLHDFLPDGL